MTRYRSCSTTRSRSRDCRAIAGVHAAGVVIAPGPLDEYVPVCTQATKGAGRQPSDDETVVVTQYDMNAPREGRHAQDGLPRPHDAHRHPRRARMHRGARTASVPPTSNTLPLDDAETVYALLRTGRTAGVFQFESPLATDMLRGMRCDRFDDLVASNALHAPRPARRRHAQGVHPAQARRGAGRLSAAGAEADSRADVRRHHLSGTGDAHRAAYWPASRSPKPTCCARRSGRRTPS